VTFKKTYLASVIKSGVRETFKAKETWLEYYSIVLLVR